MIGKVVGVAVLCLTIGLSSARGQSNSQTKGEEYSSGRGELNVWTTDEVARQKLSAGTYDVKVRIGAHTSYDRVVFEFEGGMPNYWVYYEKPPITLYSSEEVKGIRGKAFIEVSLSPIIYTEKNYNLPVDRIKVARSPLRTRLVSDVWSLGWFEGEFIYAVGLGARRPFRVQVFSNPDRLVLDFKK